MANQLSPDAPTPLWTIVRIEDTSMFDPATGASRGKRVTFALPDGTRSYVDVPLAQFDKTHVAEAINDMVSAHVEVLGLEGPPVSPSF